MELPQQSLKEASIARATIYRTSRRRSVAAQKRCYLRQGNRRDYHDRYHLAGRLRSPVPASARCRKLYLVDDAHINGCNDLTALEQAGPIPCAARPPCATRHVIKPAAAEALAYWGVRNLLPSATM